MPYALKIATRYLTAAKAQTTLLVFGDFIFMSALIGGLAEFIMSRTAGDMTHITIQAEAVDPALLDTAAFIPLIVSLPGVVPAMKGWSPTAGRNGSRLPPHSCPA